MGRPKIDTSTEARTTKIRHVRVDDPTWHTAAARAGAEGETISAVVRRLLREYAAGASDSDREP